jgi:hypothetical protein
VSRVEERPRRLDNRRGHARGRADSRVDLLVLDDRNQLGVLLAADPKDLKSVAVPQMNKG